MTRSILQKRSLHRKRAPPIVVTLPLNIPTTTKDPKPDPKATATTSTTATTATTTTADPHSTSSTVSTTSSTTVSTTSTSSSTSISSTSISTTPVLATTSSIPRSTVPIISSATLPPVVVFTTTRVPSSKSTQSQLPSETAEVSSGASAATLIGGIGGALAATLVITVLVGFFLRRWNRKRSAEDAFNASQFRRSGALLDENEDSFPRPPSMIERRNVTPLPAAAYPYSDEPPSQHAQFFPQHSANQEQYRSVPLQTPTFAAGNQFGGNGGAPAMYYGGAVNYGQGDPFTGYSGPGLGAPPLPGTNGPGAYASYGVDPRYPQPQRHPHPQQYQNQQPQQLQHPQQELHKEESVSSLTNPISPIAVPTPPEPTEGSIPESASTDTSASSAPSSSSNPEAPFVNRQSRELPPPAYTNNGGYADVQRDVKMPPPKLVLLHHRSDTAVTDTDTTQAVGGTTTTTTMTKSDERELETSRPNTVYNDDEVYGGM